MHTNRAKPCNASSIRLKMLTMELNSTLLLTFVFPGLKGAFVKT